jgi:myo-inositol-1(or 4)-monophosphatase
LLVEEAGGVVTNWRGEPYDIYRGQYLATNGKIHEQMVEVLTKVRGGKAAIRAN